MEDLKSNNLVKNPYVGKGSCNRWYGFRHTYGPWNLVEDGDLTCDGRKRGKYFIQEKKCTMCGFIKRNTNKSLIV